MGLCAAFIAFCMLAVLPSSPKAEVAPCDHTTSRPAHLGTSHARCIRSTDGTPTRAVEDVMKAALMLLPEQPAYVSLIDPGDQDDVRIREAIGRLEAFTLAGKTGVYVNLHGPTLERALATRDEGIYRFDLHVLAAMVWHEMAHLAAADEAEAQDREERLWRQFVLAGRIDPDLGLRQMQIYAARRPR